MSTFQEKKSSRPPRREGERNNFRAGGAPRKRPPRQEGGEAAFEDRPTSLTDALVALDLDLMKLLAKRSRIVQRLRGGKERAATPRAIQDEKAVRTAWEKNALSFSKDPRFSRDLFSLLQELKLMTKDQAEGVEGFLLSPAQKPVAANIHGPACDFTVKMYLALAASLGQGTALSPVLFSDNMADFVAALSRGGVLVEKKAHGATTWQLALAPAKPLGFAGSTMHVGDCLFSLHLFAFLAAKNVGTLRLTGDAGLKNTDLAGLRVTMPRLGARLSHVVPRSKGVPVNLECSGMLPPVLIVPEELPFEGVCALVVAAVVWNMPITLDLAALPAAVAASALAFVQPLLAECGANITVRGPLCIVAPAALQVPACPALPTNPVLGAYLFAMPAFAGGSITLKGPWPAHTAASADAAALLQWAGVQLSHNGVEATATCHGEAFAAPLHGVDLEGDFLPLYTVLAAQACLKTGAFTLPVALAGKSLALANELFSQLGLVCNGTVVQGEGQSEKTEESVQKVEGQDASQGAESALAQAQPATGLKFFPKTMPWASPTPYWSMALTLAALTRSGLRLVNPGSVTSVMPSYWGIINSLPAPFDPAAPSTKPRENTDAAPRRRIIADE